MSDNEPGQAPSVSQPGTWRPGPAGPWPLLQEAQACLDPDVEALRLRTDAPDGCQWLTEILGGIRQQDSPAARLACQAAAMAAQFAREPAAPPPGDRLEVLLQAWAVLAEHAPPMVSELATQAIVASDLARAAASRCETPVEPRRAGKYDLLQVIGRGASGTVHEARHRDNGKPGAVKLLRIDVWDPAQVERFREEARIIARLQHPSIVGLLDSGVEEIGGVAVPFLVSELVRGRCFSDATAGWPLVALLRTFAAVCSAVVHAHERGILHRDLKSHNVLVDDCGQPHLLDFGIAKMVEGQDPRRTHSGLLLGTPTAMSPEQAAGAPVDECSEVWSLGALLFEGLTGVPPHDLTGLAGASVLRRIAEQEPRKLAALRPDLPRDAIAVVGKALASDRRERYPKVQLLLDDVHRLAAGDPVVARPPSAWRMLRQLARRHRGLATTLVAILITLVGGGTTVAVFWWRADAARIESLLAMERTLGFAGRLVEMATPSDDLRRLLEDAISPIAGQNLWTADIARLRVESRLREYLGDLEHRSGNGPAARRERCRVRDIEMGLLQRGAGNRADFARALVKLGDLDRTERPEDAQAAFAQAHSLLLAAAAQPEASTELIDDLGWSYERMAVEAVRLQRWADARRLLLERLASARVLLLRHPDGLRHYGLASGLSTMLDLVEMDPTRELDPGAVRALLEEACGEIGLAIATDPERNAFLSLGVLLHCRAVFSALAADDLLAAATRVAQLGRWLDTLMAAGTPPAPAVLSVMRAHDSLGRHFADRGDQAQANHHFEGAIALAETGEEVARRGGASPAVLAAFRRAAWLAALHSGNQVSIDRQAARILEVVDNLQAAPESADALIALGRWSLPRAPQQARELLATARRVLRAAPADDPGIAALVTSLEAAEEACSSAGDRAEGRPVDRIRR